MFKKNTAVTGFTFHLRSATDGSDTTTGTPVGYVTLDGGTQTAIGDVTPVHEGNGEWSVDLTAAEMNGDIVSLIFVLAGSITADFKIKTTEQLVDDIWDEALTGGTHNVTNSAGKRLRQIDAAFEVHSGTAQAGAATTITLDTGASATDNIYRGDRIIIVGGTGIGEHDICTAYNGTTKVATVAETWVITPDATSEFILVPASVDVETWQHTVVTGDGDWAAMQSDLDIITGTNGVLIDDTESAALVDEIWDEVVTGHTTNNTTGKILKGISEGWISAEASVNDASATTTSFITDLTSAVDSFYSNTVLVFITGALKGQSRPIITYNGTTKVVTFDEAFSSAPADTDQFIILNGHTHPVSEIQAGLATEAKQDAQDAIITEARLSELDAANLPAVIDAILAMLDDPRAEPGQGAPAVNADMATKVDYLYKFLRNKKEQTATTLSVYDDAGTTVDHKVSVSDDGTTASSSEVIAGP